MNEEEFNKVIKKISLLESFVETYSTDKKAFERYVEHKKKKSVERKKSLNSKLRRGKKS